MRNNRIPSREVIRHLREQYPKGARVELVSMNDPYNLTLKSGDQGTVSFVDDMGTIFVSWDCSSGLSVVYGDDYVRKL